MTDRPERSGRKPRRRLAPRRRPAIAGAAALFLAAVALAAWSLQRGPAIWAVGRRLECTRAVWGALDETVEIDAVVVRDEKVYVAPVSGRIRLIASEGQRLRAGAVVAEVADDEMREQEGPALARARDESSAFEEYARARLGSLDKHVAALRLDVENEKRAVVRARSSGDTEAARESATALAEAKKALDSAIAGLERERKSLELKRQRLSEAVGRREAAYERAVFRFRAERPALVSFELDGLEGVLAPSTCASLDADQTRSLVPSVRRVGDGEEVEAGQRVFRLVDNSRLFVLAFLASDEALELGGRRAIRLSFAGIPGGPFPATRVPSVRDPGSGGKSALLLEVSGFPEQLCRERRVRVRIITKSASGLVIPAHSVVREGERDVVYVPANLGVATKAVRVKASDGDRAVVDGLKGGDRVVTSPAAIPEARITVWR